MKDEDIIRDIIGKETSDLMKDYLDEEPTHENLAGFYVGKVINNNDSEKLGRCQIRVYSIFDPTIPDGDLPWAIPDFNFIGSTLGSFIVPPINALVNVYFDRGDVYLPRYTTKVLDRTKLPSKSSEDYPNSMVFYETDEGDYFVINRKTKVTTFHHSSGTEIIILKNGDYKMNVEGNRMVNEGSNFCDQSGTVQTALGGNLPVLYCKIPGLAAITDVSQIGISTNATVKL